MNNPVKLNDDAPLVDTHAHVYTTDMPLSATAWHKPPEDATIEQYLATLDQHGVRYAVLAAASLYDDYNEYSLEATRKHKRLRTTAIVRPTIDQYLATLDQHGVRYAVLAAASLYDDYNEYSLEATRKHKRLRTTAIVRPIIDPYIMRMMKNDGVTGVRLQWRNVKNPPDITTPEYRKFLRRVADLDWHVHLNQSGELIEQPIAALEAAGVKIVIDHFGHPQRGKGVACAGFQAVMRSVERGNTWVKLSAGYRMESPEVAEACARELVKHCGPERLLWGSDWPFAAFETTVRYSDTIGALKRWVPDAAVRRIIGGETALRFYFT